MERSSGMERPVLYRLKELFPDLLIHNNHSDLYIADPTSEVKDWLKHNYENYKNCTFFIGAKGSDMDGMRCICIPFEYMPFWEKIQGLAPLK